MKINTSTALPTVSADKAAPRAALAKAYSETAGPASSRVALSAESRRLAALQDGSADIDTAKVAAIKAAIEAGKYTINTGNIAAGIIASAQELVK